MLHLIPLLLQASTPAARAADATQDIVVVAKRGKCGVAIANRLLSSREFNARAAEWATGVAVRVVVPAGSDYRCLAKIMFRLQDKGVTRADFVTK